MRGLAIGVLAVGIILDLPVVPGDQLRPRRAGRAVRGGVRPARRQLALELLPGPRADRSSGGALVGALLELGIVRRLFRAPRVVLLVATIGAAQLLLTCSSCCPNIAALRPRSPPRSPKQWTIGGVVVRADHVVALVVFPTLVLALAWFLNRTKAGMAVRASADNPDAARLSGISIKRMSTVVWAMAGAFAAVGDDPRARRWPAPTSPAPASSARASCCGPSPPR